MFAVTRLRATGAEGEARASWLRYLGEEVRGAIRSGVPVAGICLYPIMNFPGWEDNRHCHNGLWDYPDEAGAREIHEPLAEVLLEQSKLPEFASGGVVPAGDRIAENR